MRLMRPGLRTDEPELCSLGESAAKAAGAFGVNSALSGEHAHEPCRGPFGSTLGSSAIGMVAEISPKPVDVWRTSRFDAAQQDEGLAQDRVGSDEAAHGVHDGL